MIPGSVLFCISLIVVFERCCKGTDVLSLHMVILTSEEQRKTDMLWFFFFFFFFFRD